MCGPVTVTVTSTKGKRKWTGPDLKPLVEVGICQQLLSGSCKINVILLWSIHYSDYSDHLWPFLWLLTSHFVILCLCMLFCTLHITWCVSSTRRWEGHCTSCAWSKIDGGVIYSKGLHWNRDWTRPKLHWTRPKLHWTRPIGPVHVGPMTNLGPVFII
jgi:hypothetical protein